MSRPPDPGRISELCRAAQFYVQNLTGVFIDTSDESLAFVDHYLRMVQTGQQPKLAPEVLDLIAAALGAHLGEVAIGKFGGRWYALAEAGGEDPRTWRVELATVPLTFDPVGMAAEALLLADAPGYDASFSTTPRFAAALTEALGRLAPVTEECYYSLTGRLETLTYVVELLTEFERQEREKTEAALGTSTGERDPGDGFDTN